MIRVLRRANLIAYLPIILVKMKIGGVSNSSIKNLIKKSHEDYLIIKDNKIGGIFTLACKNLRKISQFFV
jgi:glycosyltransferase